MKRRDAGIVVAILVLASAFSFAVTILPENVGATTLFVGGSGQGNYSTIQSAIDDAFPGDTVYVYNGTYHEHILISKPLSVRGEDRNTTIIEGDWLGGDVVHVSADWVNFTGFLVTHSGASGGDAGIDLAAVENCYISDNNVSINYYGIRLGGVRNSNISGNYISLNYGNGISIGSSNNLTVRGNNITDNDSGIRIGQSDNITITANELSLNWVASIKVQYSSFLDIVANNVSRDSGGVDLFFSEQITVANNTLSSNNGHGVSLRLANNNTIIDNDLYRNKWAGILLRDSMFNTVVNNTITDNVVGGIVLRESVRNIITQNPMFGNGIHIEGDFLQHWNTHMIDTLNTVNGKPVYYWKNVTGGTIPLDAGEAILANCTGVLVQNLDVSNGTVGVETGFSSWNTIVNNTASLNDIAGILLDHSDDTTIYNNTALSNYEHGIYVILSENISITHNNASSNRNGIYLYDQSNNNVLMDNNMFFNSDSGVYLRLTDNNSVKDNTAIGNGMDAIFLGSSTNIVVINNTMVENGVYVRGELLEHWNTHIIDPSNSVNVKPVVYWKNTTGGTVLPGAGQIILANCTNVVVSGQNVSDGTAGVEIGHSQWISILNNTAASNNREGIFLSHTSNATVAQNNASKNMHGIYSYYDSYYLTVVNNTASSNDGQGIRAGYSFTGMTHYSLFANNTVSSNTEEGIHVEGTLNNITNNTVLKNKWGIYLRRISNTNITQNNVTGNDFGIYCLGSCDGNLVAFNGVFDNGLSVRFSSSDLNTFANNSISQSWDMGFRFYGSDSNTIVGNKVIGSAGTGIHVEYSDDNRIYHNDFIHNGLQAYDSTATNIWDDGYPSGGNYWSNYTGIDECSGPNQDVYPDPDEIGDTPYIIDADSRDRYPKMSPSEVGLPRPPTVSRGTLSGKDFQNVTITWALSPDDGLGFKSIVEYRVYRNTTYDPRGSNYTFIASLPNGTTEFDDVLVGEGNPNNYFYRVCAIDLNNRTACTRNQAGKFTRPLSEGPNLVSIPLIQANEGIETVLETLRFDKVWAYDTLAAKWNWHMRFKPYGGELRTIDHKVGVWVNVTEESNLTVAGIVPTSTLIHLDEGWNLVGFPSFDDNYTVAELKATVAVERIEGFDGLAPPYFLRVKADGDFLQAGFGYWIRVVGVSVWIVDGP